MLERFAGTLCIFYNKRNVDHKLILCAILNWHGSERTIHREVIHMDYINLADILALERGSQGLQLLFWYNDDAITKYAIR